MRQVWEQKLCVQYALSRHDVNLDMKAFTGTEFCDSLYTLKRRIKDTRPLRGAGLLGWGYIAFVIDLKIRDQFNHFVIVFVKCLESKSFVCFFTAFHISFIASSVQLALGLPIFLLCSHFLNLLFSNFRNCFDIYRQSLYLFLGTFNRSLQA